MKKRKFLISLLCLSAMLGVSATALTSCKPKNNVPPTPEVEYWKVTIDYNDGKTPKATKDVVKGEKLTGVTTPTREGYEFTGWKANGSDWTMNTPITADITIVAQWKEKETPPTPVKEYWTVTIDLNDGTEPTTKQVEKGQKLTGVTEPTREGYEFTGWKVNDADWTMDTAITADITIVAQWKEKETPPTPTKEYWTVTIDLNDGSTPTTKQVEKGQKLTGVAEPTREGYEFAGWKANDADWTMDEAITADITIVAQWDEITFSIIFDMHGHGTEPAEVTGVKALPAELPTVESVTGWGFVGWYLDADYTIEAVAGAAITSDVTLHAKWISQTPYEAFVSKGNLIYASDFTSAEEVILNSNSVNSYEEAYGKWVGTINDYDDFDDTNDVFIQNGYLNVVDDSSKTTYAQLMLEPVYASIIEVKAVLQPSTVAGSWSLFTLMSPYSSSEYLLNLRTNSNKQICLQTLVYNPTTKEYNDPILPASGGFVYVENKSLGIEAPIDLSKG
ncbi:MAG: InlB B-repeat-containing protein, partial [Anaeroplasmataceae bacterium]|nr:InlB B-repeat-containing protein [Anaeroplasmataceae bacterium]